MIISVKVKTGSREDSVLQKNEDVYSVTVKANPIKGEANSAVISLLSRHFGVPKTSISLKSGSKSRIKRFEIDS